MNSSKEIIAQITKAIAAHSFWKTHLRVAISDGESKHDPDTIRSPHNCAFGKWLDDNTAKLSHFSEFGTACELHEQFHVATSEVMKLALAGKSDEAESRIDDGSEFSEISTNLTRTMMAWKKSAAA